MSSKSKRNNVPTTVRISSDVVRQIHQHARSNNKMEVCGVLIGSDRDGVTTIEACISGVNATQGGAHVTFTQDTWEHIYKIKDRDYPNDRIVGWYHSHPGFGVFLSDHDTFIHKNFFSSPLQVAWVYDPHTDEEGCFGWAGDRIERLSDFSVFDQKGGEGAGETGKPEPTVIDVENANDEQHEKFGDSDKNPDDPWPLIRVIITTTSYIAVFLLGAALVWFFLVPPPRILLIPVDPLTGRQVAPAQEVTARDIQNALAEAERRAQEAGQNNQENTSTPAAPNNSGNTKGNDVQRH